MEKVTKKLSEEIFRIPPPKEFNSNRYTEWLNQLKQKFNETTKYDEKIYLLTTLPMSWTSNEIRNFFSVPRYMADKVKELVSLKGPYSYPEKKRHYQLPQETKDLVVEFYKNDKISRVMAGRKDYVSVKVESGERIHEQKRLILFNLNEAYTLFKEEYPNVKVGFTRFFMLRPKEVQLFGPKGTHFVCVCSVHQNVKLMFDCFKEISSFSSYKECMLSILCTLPTPNCYFNECASCPLIDELSSNLTQAFDDNAQENVTFNRWKKTDGCQLETITKPVNDFVEDFCNGLSNLKIHSFIAKQQGEHLINTKKI